MIQRQIAENILAQVGKYPVITVTGPRQSGKTTLIKDLFADFPYFSLENPDTQSRFENDPRGLFQQYGHKMVIDEVQRVPQILSYIQGIVDDDPAACFILSGSHNLLMLESVSQTLAGRTAIFYLQPLSYSELKSELSENLTATDLCWKGGYPRIFHKALDPTPFYQAYIATYVQRDVRQIKNIGDLGAFTRFLGVCAGFIGQTINKTSIADAAGIERVTAQNWLSILETSFVTYQLQPYFRNFKKRLVKSPKLYFRDTGLACALLGLQTPEELFNYYQRGAIFENFVINEISKTFFNRGLIPSLYFWRDSNQREIDLLINIGGKLRPVEIKSGATYRSDYFKQLKWFSELADVPLHPGVVVYGGDEHMEFTYGEVVGWKNIEGILNPIV
ncbi:MAG: ATP-binding protein [Bacteroidota bacterium]